MTSGQQELLGVSSGLSLCELMSMRILIITFLSSGVRSIKINGILKITSLSAFLASRDIMY